MNKNIIYAVIVVIILVGIGAYFWSGSDSKNNNEEKSDTNTTQDKASSANTENSNSSNTQACNRTFNNSDLNKVTINTTDKFVTLQVEGYGDIKIELNRTDAPKTSENFLKLAKSGFYDCLTFHRVAKGFVVQGGDPQGDGTGGPGYTIPAEIKLKHTKGSIAMARQGDEVNPNRESSGSQFYISLEALPMLDGQYTVFGQVVGGMDIVEKIGGVPITPGPFGGSDGAPVNKIVINKAVVSDK